MDIAFARTMPHFSMDVYANGVISGLHAVQPDWKILEVAPKAVDRDSRSPAVRAKKGYERFWRFPHQVQRQEADIYHIIDNSDAHLIHWLRKTEKPIVVTCHDLINFYYSENLKTSVRLPFVSDALWQWGNQAMKYADAIVAVSTATAEDVMKIFMVEESRIFVIPNAVDPVYRVLPQSKATAFRQRLGATNNTICLLNVGSVHPRKNIPKILETINALKQRNIDCQFWKASGDFTPDHKQFIQHHGLESHIHYLGYLDQASLVEAYNAADILLAPSLHEGFGLTLLESMACGTPVITSNTSAMPDVVGEAGILVNPRDSTAIADAICRLSTDLGFYSAVQAKGMKRVKSFSWNSTAEKIAELYIKLLK